jgi:serine-type D-Ala-D-Ala carboxypeptidase (penicillin-binding protein 5/6)
LGGFHKFTSTVCALATLFAVATQPGPAEAAPRLMPNPEWKVSPFGSLSAGAAVLIDWQTGRILWQKNAFYPRDPASTTKVLTALIALEKAKLTDPVKVSRRAAYTPGSSMYIKPGEIYSMHDLLHGLLLRSGNDAAAAIAEHVGGSIEGFAALMNAKSREIGAVNSHWVNPHGLTAQGHVSTAYDLALITRHAMRHETFRTIVSTPQASLTFEQLGRDVVLHNTNRLLRSFPGADGVKTGTTAAAGACLIASATRDHHKLISVVLHAGNRWNDAARLLEWGFQNFRLATLAHAGEVVVEAPIRGGKTLTVPLALTEDLTTVMPKSHGGAPMVKLQVQEAIQAPLKKGQPLGRASVKDGDQQIDEALLVAAADVPEATWLDYLYRALTPLLRWVSGN